VRIPPALHHRDFRLFAIGYFPAETAEYIHLVVQNWLVWELMPLSLLLLKVVGAMQTSYPILGRAMSLFFLDHGFGSLGAVYLGRSALLIPVPRAVAGGAVLFGLVTWLLPKRGRSIHVSL
jgi:hypothetical protein